MTTGAARDAHVVVRNTRAEIDEDSDRAALASDGGVVHPVTELREWLREHLPDALAE